MNRIAPKGKWMMVDGFNVVEGPDHRGYVEIFSWHDEEPPETAELPGIPVSVDATCEVYVHAGREWIYLTAAPEPVSDKKMPAAAAPSCPTCAQVFRGVGTCAKPECVRAAAAYATAPRAVFIVEMQPTIDGKPVPGLWEPVELRLSLMGANTAAARITRALLGVNVNKPVRVRELELKP